MMLALRFTFSAILSETDKLLLKWSVDFMTLKPWVVCEKPQAAGALSLCDLLKAWRANAGAPDLQPELPESVADGLIRSRSVFLLPTAFRSRRDLRALGFDVVDQREVKNSVTKSVRNGS